MVKVYDVIKKQEKETYDMIVRHLAIDANFLVTVPHGGMYIPEIYFQNINYRCEGIACDVDHCSLDLFDLDKAIVVQSLVHRCVVDLNRNVDEKDIFRKKCFDGTDFMIKDYDNKQIAQIMLMYYTLFNIMVDNAIKHLTRNKDKILVINGHTMQPYDPITHTKRPAFVIGTNHGTSAEERVIKIFYEVLMEESKKVPYLEKFDKRVVIDYPKLEGTHGLTSRLGNPKKGINALLVEVNQNFVWYDGKKDNFSLVMVKKVLEETIKEVLKEIK